MIKFKEFLTTESVPDLNGLIGDPKAFCEAHQELTGYDFHIMPASCADTADTIELLLILDGKDGADETVTSLCYKPYPPISHVENHKTFQSANDAYDLAISNDYLVVKSDEPKRLMLGWLEIRNSGTVRHTMRLSLLKEAQQN